METAVASCILKETIAPCNDSMLSQTLGTSADEVRIMTNPRPAPLVEMLKIQKAPAVVATSIATVGLQRIKDEIMRLRHNCIYAIPVLIK
jgi:hypothetical protein